MLIANPTLNQYPYENVYYKSMKRLFIGIPILSETAVKAADRWRRNPELNLNRLVWTKPSNWHITLFFLGATPEQQVPILEQMIDEAFSPVQPITTELSGVGVFPEKGKPRVLWIGLDNLQALFPAYDLLGELLLKGGFIFDPKPLKPHLTLARVKSLTYQTSLEALLGEYQSFHFGMVDINRVTLFESVSTTTGVLYQPLFEKWLLKVHF